MPEDYFLAADGDYFYVSTIELPWAQAQYECLARKGHLAELDGMYIFRQNWGGSGIANRIIARNDESPYSFKYSSFLHDPILIQVLLMW